MFLINIEEENVMELIFKLTTCGYIFAIIQFMISVFVPAPYGKFSDKNSVSRLLSGFQMDVQFAWFIQECPSFFIPTFCILAFWDLLDGFQVTLLLMFICHYFQRSFIFPILINSKTSKAAPILTTSMAFLFCSYNGFLQAISITFLKSQNNNLFMLCTGFVIFIIGFLININSDHQMRELRKKLGPGHHIPRGGLFNYVSTANYFGEILEWWGFCLANYGSAASLFFAIFTTLFLGTRSFQTHKYYLEKFKEDYPKDRKALIPLIL